jgi:hypothetical protein
MSNESPKQSPTQDDSRLILEVLESERTNLAPEIRRTDTPDFRDRFRARLEQVDRLVSIIREALAPVPPRASGARKQLTRKSRRCPRRRGGS